MERFDEDGTKREGSLSDPTSKKRLRPMDAAMADNDVTILSLNDHCLLEVFKYLDFWDLGAAADVCNRFRQNAKACFGYSKEDYLNLCDLKYFKADQTLNQVILRAARFLRNFGGYITKLKAGAMNQLSFTTKFICPEKWVRTVVELLVRYPIPTLTDLELEYVDFDDDFAATMGPLFERLHKVTLRGCQIDGMFLSLWPLWSAELRELRWDWVRVPWGQYQCFHQPFPKLVKIGINDHENLQITEIVEMLRHNPQLKELELSGFQGPTPFETILPAITQYIPQIESLNMCFGRDTTIAPLSIQCFSQLRKLRSLTLRIGTKPTNQCVQARRLKCLLIEAISAAGISLKYLCLKAFDFSFGNADRFVDAVSRFQQLEKLQIEIGLGLTASHLIEICKNCREISEFTYIGDVTTTPTNILQIVRNLTKLQSMWISPVEFTDQPKNCIDTNIFMQLVKMVENRSEKTHLTIRLHNYHYTLDVPDDLVRKHQKLLSIFFDYSQLAGHPRNYYLR